MSRFAAVSSRPFPNGGFPSFPATKSARPRAKSRQARARASAKAAEPHAKDRRIRIRAPAEPHTTAARQRAEYIGDLEATRIRKPSENGASSPSLVASRNPLEEKPEKRPRNPHRIEGGGGW